MKAEELKDLHNCKKCRGKIVLISIDNVGITRCGYCNEIVDYKRYYEYKLKQKLEKKYGG